MNPIKQLLLEERRNSQFSVVRAGSNNDEDDLPVIEPIPLCEPAEESTVSTANEDYPDPKEEVKVEKDSTKTDHMTHKASTTSSSSSDLIVPTTDLTRQNMCRALQPGAYEVTAAHIYRVDDRPDGAMDSDIESNIGNSHVGEIGVLGRAPSQALIQAELVTARSSSFRNEPHPPSPQPIPQAAEVVEPIDPSLIKQQIMEVQMENKPRTKWIFFAVGLLVLLVASFATFVLLRDNRGSSQSSLAADNKSSQQTYCNQQQIQLVCEEFKNRANAPTSSNNATQVIAPDDGEVMNRLFSQFGCVPTSQSNVCSSSGGEQPGGTDERNSNVDSGGNVGGPCPIAISVSDCPPGKSTEVLCQEILSIVQRGGLPVNIDYTPYCAKTIAESCSDPNTVCDVWDDIFDDSEDRR